MAKKSRNRVIQLKKDQSGCMKSLFNIFDFREGLPSQRMLQDKKHESKRFAGAGYSDIQLESLSEPCEICKESNDAVQSEILTNDDGKLSIKELMEEEMIDEPVQKRPRSKTNRRTRSMTSLNLNTEDVARDEVGVAEKPSHRKHKSLSSVYLNVMVEELCTKINHKHGDLSTQLIEDPSVVEETLWEATRILISQCSDGKSIAKDGEIQASKELADALQIIDSNKQMFLKLLQDPNSELVKHIQNLQHVQVEEGKFKLLTNSNLLEKGIDNGKQQRFFWRRIKGLERNPSKKYNDSEDLNRRDLETASPCSSLPESPQSMEERNKIKRVASSFSFAEFRRKLKHVMRKQQGGVIQNGMTYQLSNDQQNLTKQEKKVVGATVTLASPSKDHFFIEKIPSLVGVKKADKTGKLKDGALHFGNDMSISDEERVSNIYVEAKKHLSEIISDKFVDEDSPRNVPKSLGRLMFFSGYNSPTLCSPRKEGKERLSSHVECPTDDKSCQIEAESHTKAETHCFEPCISGGISCKGSADNLAHDARVSSVRDMCRSTNVESQEENNLMESSAEYVDCPSNLECSEENWHPPKLGQDTCTDSDVVSSQVASTLACSLTDKNEDQELMSDATSKPSPISVLEPLFMEDVVSPPSIRSLSGNEPFQLRKINFEEETLAPSNHYPRDKTYIDYDEHTFHFVRAVVQMSGLTWDNLHRRTLFLDYLIDPSLIDEVDFIPDLLPFDFNLIFDLINEVLIEISWLNFGCVQSVAKPSTLLKLKNKDIFAEIWKGVEWCLKLEGPPRTLDQLVEKDLAKSTVWMNLQPDTETIGIQLEGAILEELLEDTFLAVLP